MIGFLYEPAEKNANAPSRISWIATRIGLFNKKRQLLLEVYSHFIST